jgi:beta-galactosidase/beta-glucuronidase
MKSYFISSLFILFVLSTEAQQWRIVEGRLTTEWAGQVKPESPLPDYPRPQMVRDTWLNLNGLWDYAILPMSESNPATYEGKILVPFAIESALSGVGKSPGRENQLWYKHTFTVPAAFKNKRSLLHFGAVDWLCDVFVNGTKVGSHEGGYDPFFFDITDALKPSGAQEIIVSVWDPSDDGPQPRGKQVKTPQSIWYTPVSGIWQTVWLEAVPKTFITSVKNSPDIDKATLTIKVTGRNIQQGDRLKVFAWDGSSLVAQQEGEPDQIVLNIPNAKLWSPGSPFLYDLRLILLRKGKVIDEVKSYFGMRKISMKADAAGVQRMLLNNQFVFQYGPLDQGWWPDGLYTGPTDEALKFDIQKTKDMGFNMIRKHVKVEPARWYYHCDKLGMLVWQDMPSGDMGNRWDDGLGTIGLATDRERTVESERIYRKEWKAIIDATYHFPSIIVWVPFNEGWGQFKTRDIVEWTMSYDPSRLVNEASGGNFEYVGHILDIHHYPDPVMPSPQLFGQKQVLALGEYGGLGFSVEGHTWQAKNNWGYQSFMNQAELLRKYEAFIDRFPPLISKGLSAVIYTQTTDVEIEVNGLMTYDRKVIKMPEERLKQIHSKLYDGTLVKFN